MKHKVLNILDVPVNNVTYFDLLEEIRVSILHLKKITMTSVNVNTINLANNVAVFRDNLSQIEIKHPDGIGVYLASRFLFGKDGLKSKITGSDFYNELKKHSIKNNWSFFFFGDKEETLSEILKVNPELHIKGMQNGYIYDSAKLVNNINTSNPDILLVGLGSPKQENWIVNHKSSLNANVIIAVGDGIKMFSGTKKRGPSFIQKLGLEWVVRLMYEPKRLWKRYLIGNPIFVFKILKMKLVGTRADKKN
jgi:N-acetylglucosaminyldiphosphoundecaprenol N-acetyl-beta-D-mannosaminyltransferase